MHNYKITLQYDGTKYNGWQRQGNAKNTIQERVENVLSLMCDADTEIFASGRTDAGVHAMGQVANFKCEKYFEPRVIKDYMNHYLPADIKVLSAEEADVRFHSRLNALSKTYEYKIAVEKPDVFLRKYVYYAEKVPDVSAMNEAAQKLLGTHDLRGFSSLGKTKKSTVRTINEISVTQQDGIIKIRINGNGFLYNTVRIIAGTLYMIGTGEMDINSIDKVLETGDRQYAGITLPATGLCLLHVYY